MARILKWSAVIVGALLLLALAMIFVFGVLRFGGMPMMARGFRGPFVFGGGLRYMFLPFFIGRLLIPLAFIALLILGGFAIGRSASRPQIHQAAVAATTPCPNCGKAVQADWNHCPSCGVNLKTGEPPATPVQEDIT
jgi:hypothetical protein